MAHLVDEINQGYFMRDDERCVRLRKRGNGFELTLKAQKGVVGKVDEFNIPCDEPQGQAIIALCRSRVKKNRHLVQVGEFLWEIDLFLDHNNGFVLAEVELDSDEQSARLTATLPDWVAEEVTGQPQYFNTWLAENVLPR